MTSFNKGDRVVYVGSNRSFLNAHGTVTYTYPREVAVELDGGRGRVTFPNNHFTRLCDHRMTATEIRNSSRFTVCGVPDTDVVAILDVMAKHHIPPSAAALDVALGPKKPAKARVNVYDRVNPERLLGSIERPNLMQNRYGDEFHLCVMPPMRVFNWFDDDPNELHHVAPERVTFTIRFNRSLDGWSQEAVLLTSADLKVLQGMKGFCLPGETEAQAARRLYR